MGPPARMPGLSAVRSVSRAGPGVAAAAGTEWGGILGGVTGSAGPSQDLSCCPSGVVDSRCCGPTGENAGLSAVRAVSRAGPGLTAAAGTEWGGILGGVTGSAGPGQDLSCCPSGVVDSRCCGPTSENAGFERCPRRLKGWSGCRSSGWDRVGRDPGLCDSPSQDLSCCPSGVLDSRCCGPTGENARFERCPRRLKGWSGPISSGWDRVGLNPG